MAMDTLQLDHPDFPVDVHERLSEDLHEVVFVITRVKTWAEEVLMVDTDIVRRTVLDRTM